MARRRGAISRRRNTTPSWRRRTRRRSAWPTSAATATSTRSSSGAARTSRTPSDLAVQAPPLYIQEKVHPKVLIDDLLCQTKERREEEAPARAGPLRRFQRPARRRGDDRVLPPRRQLVEPHDPRRQPAGHGVAGGARGPARQGAVHLYRPALRHPLQLQLPVVHHQPRREGTARPSTSPASPSR